jgi:hypothetical protein
MQYLNKFNHLSQYAIGQVDTDLKKKNCFMRGCNTLNLENANNPI